MFGNLFKRLKGTTSGLVNSAISVDDVKVMEAMVASMALVAYANNVCEDKEVDAVNKMIESNPALVNFHNEPVRLFDSYCDQMEASIIQGRRDMMSKISKLIGDVENSERVLIVGLEVAYAGQQEDEEEKISKEEETVLSQIARELDLRLGKYLP